MGIGSHSTEMPTYGDHFVDDDAFASSNLYSPQFLSALMPIPGILQNNEKIC